MAQTEKIYRELTDLNVRSVDIPHVAICLGLQPIEGTLGFHPERRRLSFRHIPMSNLGAVSTGQNCRSPRTERRSGNGRLKPMLHQALFGNKGGSRTFAAS